MNALTLRTETVVTVQTVLRTGFGMKSPNKISVYKWYKFLKRQTAFVKGKAAINEQSMKLRWMFEWILFTVQVNQQDKVPDIWTCHNRQCTQFYKLVWDWKLKNANRCKTKQPTPKKFAAYIPMAIFQSCKNTKSLQPKLSSVPHSICPSRTCWPTLRESIP
jgi:hypothetical protein